MVVAVCRQGMPNNFKEAAEVIRESVSALLEDEV